MLLYVEYRAAEVQTVLGDKVLQLKEGGDFEALHFHLSRNFDRCTKLDLTN